MDYRRRSSDHRTGRHLQEQEVLSDHSISNDSPNHSKKSHSDRSIEHKTRYLNKKSKKSARRNYHNDSNNEENNDETPVTEQYIRRGSIDPERTDENITDNADDKSEIKENHEGLYKREKRRKTKRRRKKRDTSISKIGESNEEDIDENRYTLDDDRKVESAGSRKQRKSSKIREKDNSKNKRDELPITEILRKSQENTRMQYEESAPLPHLTTDTIYVQGRNGFSAMKIPGDRIARGHRDPASGDTITNPIKIAIFAQKAWRNAGLIYQGLLAGMALMHFLFMHTFVHLLQESLMDYSVLGEIYTNLFSFLIGMCIVSAFDKFDLANLNWDHFREIYQNHAKAILAIPLYVTVFCLHQTTLKFDDKVSLLHYQIMNETQWNSTNSTMSFTHEELTTWQTITLTKDGLAIVAWLFIALGPHNDMLLMHLQGLKKYGQDLNDH